MTTQGTNQQGQPNGQTNGKGQAASSTALATAQADKPLTRTQAIATEFARWKPVLKAILPKHIDPDRFVKIAVNAYLYGPQGLADCTTSSMVKAALQCAEMGLDPSPLLGECVFLPFNNKKKVRDGNTWKEVAVKEVQLMPMYVGLIKLARQAGDISDVYAVVVDESEAEAFEVHEGTERRIVHRKNLHDRTGNLFAVYGVVKFKDGTCHYEVMSRGEVEAIRARSKSKDSGPWVTDFAAMAKKTAIKQALKTCPKSPEKPQLPTALAADNAAEIGEAFTTEGTAVIDAEGSAVDEGPAQPATRTDALAAKLGHDADGVIS